MVKDCPVAERLAMRALSPAPLSHGRGARCPRRAIHVRRAASLRGGHMAWSRHRRGPSQSQDTHGTLRPIEHAEDALRRSAACDAVAEVSTSVNCLTAELYQDLCCGRRYTTTRFYRSTLATVPKIYNARAAYVVRLTYVHWFDGLMRLSYKFDHGGCVQSNPKQRMAIPC